MPPTAPRQAASEADIASTFLKELGAPDTDLMRKAVIAWLRKESGSNVIGNNPWNISAGAAKGLGIEPVGYRTHSRTGQQFAVYGSLTDGTRAAARLLLNGANRKGDARGYGGVVNAARAGDPVEFLQSLARSKWSADRYGGPTNNSLLRVYKSIAGLKTITSTGTIGQPSLGAFGDLVKFPVGHIITEADVDSAMATLDKAGFFNTGIPFFGPIATDEAKSKTRAVLMQYVDKPWTKETQDQLQGTFGQAADEAAKNPLGIDLSGVSNIFDPGFWARILALIAGTALVGFGVIRLAKV